MNEQKTLKKHQIDQLIQEEDTRRENELIKYLQRKHNEGVII